MTRAIDGCTCGHDRGEHRDGSSWGPYAMACTHDGCWCPRFFPNPQPERESFAPPIYIPRLKFKLDPLSSAATTLEQAAQLLVMNQDPMPSAVRCSLIDYVTAGLDRGPSAMFGIMLPFDRFAPFDPKAPFPRVPLHRYELWPDNDVPEGEVWL